ncbi:glycoside hydrolase family 15 protein [Pedobacter sp. G11]|uniref:glycoside hydrolase family 15 protein n=1 Tax=Pedobacter sp. G11 TaxID=2482728 RepID=UPI001FEE996F|nr:glycoside hydrolase family 15 protein [Pedobacter sp. G11]
MEEDDMSHSKRPQQPIENYGIIGNLQTTALVSKEGSIDFMCAPDFDSPTLFASLLDSENGGYFAVIPELEDYQTKQLYLPGTAILLTRYFAESGIAELTDYMPISTAATDGAVVRKIKTIRGTIRFAMTCEPRFGYMKEQHSSSKTDNEISFICSSLSQNLKLIADVPLRIKDLAGCADFTLDEGQSATIVLKLSNHEPICDLEWYKANAYHQTTSYWRNWVNTTTYDGRYGELITRSAITLKLLTSIKYGSVVAAATFGLPETLGGDRNWDYRFTWIRDAAFTMYAFLTLGYTQEAENFMGWLHGLCKEIDLQLVYRIDGSPEVKEEVAPQFEGYQQSKPVRIGNAAAEQFQLDIYGELIDTIYIYNKSCRPITFEFWTLIEKQVLTVISNWDKPDHGIWEIRNEKKSFLHSRLMCWVAMDRAIKIAEHRSFPFPKAEWHQVRSDIYQDIYHDFWNEDLKAWVQYKGGAQIDASVLLMPLTHFIAPLEPRWLSTMEAVKKNLLQDVLVYRYRNTEHKFDGLEGEEGTFNMCSFWYIEALAKSGEVELATEHFEKMIGYANHLTLFSEELGKRGEHLGNFPQAFTHLALISAAVELNKQIGRQKR